MHEFQSLYLKGLPEKLTVLQFLIDEALETPTIAEYINEHETKLKELRQEKREDDAEAKREMQRERRHEARRLRGEDSETSEAFDALLQEMQHDDTDALLH